MKTKDAFKEARKQTGQDQEPSPEKFPETQGQLLGVKNAPAAPKPVRGRLMMMTFVKPIYERTKGGDPLIGLDLSMPLTEDHKGLLPDEIEHLWEVMKSDENAPQIKVSGVQPQTVKIHLVPDDKEDLVLPMADVTKATLTVVQERGKGKAKKYVRLQLRVMTERTKQIRDFIWSNDGEICWVELSETQGKLL